MADALPKVEPMDTSTLIETSEFDPVNLESAIIQLCLQFPNGVTDKILDNSFRTVTVKQRLSALNRLLSLNKIDLLKSSTEPGTLLYRIRDTSNATSSSISIGSGSIDQMERVVYQLVKESGNVGIWMRDIRMKTKLSQTILNKTLKSLESKKLIKAVKSVHASKKKVDIHRMMSQTNTFDIFGRNSFVLLGLHAV
jgi:DNA-directed RNA polymerase III subunit RPC6